MSASHPGHLARHLVVATNIMLAGLVPTACISTDPADDRREAVSIGLDRIDQPRLASRLEELPNRPLPEWPPSTPLEGSLGRSVLKSGARFP